MNWIVAFSLFLGCILSSQAALRDVIGICCDRGRQYAKRDGLCTELEFFPFFEIQESDRQACIHLSIGCCDNELQKVLCAKGIDQRANLGSCRNVEGDDCYSVQKDCCNCCELGLEAYHAGAPCEISTLGEMCNEAFQTCCQRAFNDGDVDECSIPVDFGDPFNEVDGRCSENCINVIGDYKCECEEGKVLDSDGFSCTSGVNPSVTCPEVVTISHGLLQIARPVVQNFPNEMLFYSYRDADDSSQQPLNILLSTQPTHAISNIPTRITRMNLVVTNQVGSVEASCIFTIEHADLPSVICPSPEPLTVTNGQVQFSIPLLQNFPDELLYYAYTNADDNSQQLGVLLSTQPTHTIGHIPTSVLRIDLLVSNQAGSAEASCTFAIQHSAPAGPSVTCPSPEPLTVTNGQVQFSKPVVQNFPNEVLYYAYMNADDNSQQLNILLSTQPTHTVTGIPSSITNIELHVANQAGTSTSSCIFTVQHSDNPVQPTQPPNPCDTAPCDQECRTNTVTYQCFCRRGYILNDDEITCRDENECVTGYYQCNPGEGCVNTEGGYRCEAGTQCEPGYQYDDRTRQCQDINECEKDPSVCELNQECINYDGHYYCNSVCRLGYEVILDEHGGPPACQDIDECALGIHNCANGQRCDNLPGGFRCTRTVPCGTGYTINGNSQQCEDVDECAQNLHDCNSYYFCNNTLGSYRCEPCPPGFRVAPSNVCNIDINECDDPNICQPGSRCDNTYGSYRCTSLCARGLEYVAYLSRCMDIDECARGTHTCSANQLCKNTMAGFSCQCKEGFSYDFETQTCNDIDECEEGNRIGRPKCRPHERCENIGGSHRCTPACPYGQKYERFGNIWNCTDINECLIGTHNCRGDEICVNDAYNGTYRCIRCTRGTVFNAAAKTCDDIDECNNPQGRVCLGICNNNPGSFYCTCPTGYNMIQSRVCRDVDECQVGNHRCRPDQLCFNTKGSHRCMNLQCPRYYNKRITGRQMRCDKIQAQFCPPAQQDIYNCAGNRTSPIIYFPLSLRSYPTLPQGQDVLTLRIPAPSDIIEFTLNYGNERGIFEVVKRQAHQTEGVLRLVSAVTGPYSTEVHMAINTNTGSRFEPNWVETSKAIILVDVSPFDF